MGIFEIYFFFSTKITIELFKLYNICIRNFSPIRGGIYNRCSKFSTETFYRDSSTIDMSQELSMLLGVRFLIPV